MTAVLPDGTPCHAPVGTVVRDGQRVMCHLCGGWFRSVVAHLRFHGWDHLAYRQVFGLERGEPLEGTDTRRRRASSMRVRRAVDPAVRAGCEVGQEWVRSGALARAAADAARGRRQPEQRRRKTLQTLASISPAARAEGAGRYADRRLRQTAEDAAARLGYADIGSLVRDRVAQGASLAGISREAGLHKDWLCRHLASVDPVVAREVGDEDTRVRRWDAPWLPVVRELGFGDIAGYLTDRHVTRRYTVQAIAVEVGMTRGAVETALARHGVTRVPHAASRGQRQDRATEVAARFGHPDIDAYLADRRTAGLSWRAIAAECGQPASWVRRRAGVAT